MAALLMQAQSHSKWVTIKIMDFTRKIGRFLAASLLKLSLFVFATTFALNGVIGSPEPLQDNLEKSGIFETLVPGFLEAASQEEDESGREDLPVDDPKVREVINASFSPEFLQESSGKLINGFYAWLNGEATQPEFSIDLSTARNSMIQGLADYAEDRLLSLPACTSAQARELAAQEIDPFTVKCRPPVVVSAEKQKIIDELEDSEFLEDDELSAATLTKDDPDKFTEELKGLPDGFQLLKSLPLITGVITLASATSLILLHDDKRRGIRQVGIIVLVTGLLLLVSTLLFQAIYSGLTSAENLDVKNASLRNSLIDLLGRLYGSFNRTLMIISAIYTALGVTSLATLFYMKKNDSEPDKEIKSDEKVEEKPAEPAKKA